MQKEKSVALLTQVETGFSQTEVRGVARLEKDRLSLSIINLKSAILGEYFLFYDGVAYPLKSLSGGEFALVGGAKIGCGVSLLHKNDNELKTVAYGEFSSFAKTEKEILIDAKEFFKIQDPPSKELPIFQAQDYDDEAIATENYFGFNEQSVGGADDDKGEIYGDNGGFDGRADCDKTEEEGLRADPWQDENAKGNEFSSKDGGDYYFKIKSRLNDLFRDFPPQTRLADMVKESRWAKVENGGKHYVVGVIFSRGEPKYICYGLPGCYGQESQGLCGYSSFIPLSPFDQKGNGYWVMFQHAESGKRVEKG